MITQTALAEATKAKLLASEKLVVDLKKELRCYSDQLPTVVFSHINAFECFGILSYAADNDSVVGLDKQDVLVEARKAALQETEAQLSQLQVHALPAL